MRRMTWPYDLAAEFYDEDMGRNTSGLDIPWYVSLAANAHATLGGPVLELGAGTGRITLPLAASGLTVWAVDRSRPMLTELLKKARAAELEPRLRLMVADIGLLKLNQAFAAVLCPFSTFCYLTEDHERTYLLSLVRQQLMRGGVFALDAFIPDPAAEAAAAFPKLDYRRPLASHEWAPAVMLERFKTVTRESASINRIDRVYRFLDAADHLLREVRTTSRQRCWLPDDLVAALEAAGFDIIDSCGDFNLAVPAVLPAKMASIVATSRRP
jgi:SAM-dependent methyltransferase